MNTYTDYPNTPPFGYGFIYFLRSPSGKAYIGQTSISISKRMYYHNKGRKCRFLSAAIKKYGMRSFFVGEVGCYPLHELDAMEVRFIKMFETLCPDGYNLTTGGHANRKCSDETRRRISAVIKRRAPCSVETRQRISAAIRGVPRPNRTPRHANHIEALRIANLGKHRSDETKQKMSTAKRGCKRKPFSAEHKRRLSEARKVYWEGKLKTTKSSQLRKQDTLPLFQSGSNTDVSLLHKT
jgi:group I intron endonuclease